MCNASDFVIENGILKEYIGDAERVVIPDGVVRIGESAFSGREDITEVILPESISGIGNSAFAGCVNLSGINMPESLTSIGDKAFGGCESLEISIPAHVEHIGSGAFCGCDGLADADGFVIVRSVLHYYCGESSDVVIPQGTTKIDEEAFFTSEDLKSATLPDGMTSIGEAAFSNCYELAHIVIPGSITNIGPRAFEDCEELTIYAPADSYAIAYASKNKISFVAEGEMKTDTDTQIAQIEFENKIFVHTGLSLAEEKLVDEIILSKGGILKTSTVLKTDYLIVNETFGHQTKKYLRAMELIERGANIKIIPASDFLDCFGR